MEQLQSSNCSRGNKVPGTDNGNPFSIKMKGTLNLCTKQEFSSRDKQGSSEPPRDDCGTL